MIGYNKLGNLVITCLYLLHSNTHAEHPDSPGLILIFLGQILSVPERVFCLGLGGRGPVPGIELQGLTHARQELYWPQNLPFEASVVSA